MVNAQQAHAGVLLPATTSSGPCGCSQAGAKLHGAGTQMGAEEGSFEGWEKRA